MALRTPALAFCPVSAGARGRLAGPLGLLVALSLCSSSLASPLRPTEVPESATGLAAPVLAARCAGLQEALTRRWGAAARARLLSLRRRHPHARCPLPHALVGPLLAAGVSRGEGSSVAVRGVPSRAARYEFAAFASLDGIFAGVMLDLIYRPDSAALHIAIPALLAIAGPTVAWQVTEDQGITAGTVAGVRTGAWLGAAHGLLLINAVRPATSLKQVSTWLLLHNTLGGVAGGLLASNLPADDGQAAMLTSGAIWGTAAGILTGVILTPGGPEDPWSWMLVGMDVGLIGGVVAAWRHPVSRGRVALIDAGGLLGGAFGLALPVLATGDRADSRGTALSGLLGMGLGLGAAAWLTEGQDLRDAPGGRFGLIELRVPSLTLLPSPRAGAAPVPGVGLLSGVW